MTNSLLKVLITGADGQLGRALQHHAKANLFNLIPCSRTALNIIDEASIQQALKQHRPDVVINTAAYTAVDKAEQEKEVAERINTQGPALLAAMCQANNIPLIHISTDYVFDGKKDIPYKETDTTHPINVYGQTKLLGEQAISANHNHAIILRVSSVFSEYGNNFLKTMLRLARERDTLRVVDDQIACPTYAGHIADVIYQLISNFKPGIYHYCDRPAVTWHHFAKAIIEAAAEEETLKVKEVLPITTAEYPTPAKRPPYSALDCRLIQKTFSIEQRDWQAALPTILHHLKGNS